MVSVFPSVQLLMKGAFSSKMLSTPTAMSAASPRR